MTEHERHAYREDCECCQIAICDTRGRRLPDTDPVMQAARRIWWEASLVERQACNRVWVFNSRESEDLRIANVVASRIKDALSN